MENVFTPFRRHPFLSGVGGIVLLAIIVVGIHLVTRQPATPAAPAEIFHVHISSVAGLSSQTGPLPVVGTVTSLDKAVILAQSSGQVVSLNKKLGDHVAAGEVIARFENSSQQAAVLQAEGAYHAAQAALAKATGSTATNSTLTASQAQLAATNAHDAAITALQSTYAALDDAVRTKADTLFSSPRTPSPTFNLIIPDSQLKITLQNERTQLEILLNQANTLQNSATSTSIESAISEMSSTAQAVVVFLNNLATAVNEVQPNQNLSSTAIAGYQSSVAGARTEVAQSIASLTSAKSAYDSAQAGSQTAANTATAGTGSDIAAAKAMVEQQLGALDSANANLEKTVVRSPISGTIVSLAMTQGGYVSASSQVAEVSNPGALEVDTNVTPEDAKTLAVGGKALIAETTSGVIVSIAPALDPTTNKIAVKVGITGNQGSLTDGETVTVSLDRTNKKPSTAQTGVASSTIVIPIIAAKITPQGPVVFTVSTSSILLSHPITLGTILGDQVTVVRGLTPDMDIVTDARGLSDGQPVVVDTH